ncbi:hypothetical protein Bca52824_011040 [Brassica carinata]|uniref:Protein kinase domain-containing protein n=1 Tax=Brassica carinata TaxID=52824 RepID=A0A8X8BBA2_BRACI|nr:hypothetical protein Bca52824_011040 [Brassica carinata]
MKSLHWFLLLLIISSTVLGSIEAQTQAGFISLDCGLMPTTTTYTEKTTNITYKSDVDYVDSGLVGKINDAYKTRFQQQTWSLRSFPEGQRNCYNLFNLTANSKYLIKATFMYGNYDGQNQLPSFDLHIGAKKWSSIKIIGVTNSSTYEIFHVVTQDNLQVCLVKTGPTTPFISSLELRPLNNNSCKTQSGSLMLFTRIYFPSDPSAFVRYDEDIHDRGWNAFTDNETASISTDLPIDTSNFYDMPQAVMKTAAIPANASKTWYLWWTLDDISAQSYVYMHFAEIQTLKASDVREFNITYNGGLRWYSYMRPPKLSISTIFNPSAVSSSDGKFNFTFTMTGNSTLPPLINALEIYTVSDVTQLGTDKDEVSAMMNIKKTYGLSKKLSWQGDPCSPQLYRWEGVNCSYPDSEPSLITSLFLAFITSSFSQPSLVRYLLFSVLNLSGNPKLNLPVPDSLQERVNSKSLTLIMGDTLNPTTIRGKSKKVPVLAIAVPVAGLFALVVILAFFFVVRKKKPRSNMAPGPPAVSSGLVKSETRPSNPTIITKDCRITYPEVLRMTNNFERVLGKGGFGTVYHGNLDDAQVAVKMLSHSSAQGYKEFKAEVELLLRVHHRHLVGLVGYCDDGDNLALIYEYMANGDLRENMSGKRGGNVLTWENRMQITLEAAQDKNRERPHINEWVGFMLTKGDIRRIVDPKLMGDYDTNGAWKIVELALGCVNPS